MPAYSHILNHRAVVDFFGHWPSFHDAKVRSYEPPEPGASSLGFSLHTWLTTNEVDAKGFYILRNHALVTFRFDGIHNVQMNSFAVENILFGLELLPGSDSSSFHVELDSALDENEDGSFSARSGEVISVVPCTPDGKKI